MSPVLCNIYVDDLSSALNNSMIGCSFNGVLCNHLVHADDACIVEPSSSALFQLLKICAELPLKATLSFLTGTNLSICFKPKSLSNLLIPDMYLNGRGTDSRW